MKHWLQQLKNQRRFGVHGSPDFIHPSAKVSRSSKLEVPVGIGKGSSIKHSSIGRYSYLAYDIRIHDACLGRYCSIGPEVIIGGLGKHPTDHFSTSPLTYSPSHALSQRFGHSQTDLGFQESSPVTIGNDVWIGARSIIMDGVTIGNGAIIGANTVVTKDIPPYAVFYGSPPQCHRLRFTAEVIAALQASEWWTKAPEEIEDDRLLSIIRHPPTRLPDSSDS